MNIKRMITSATAEFIVLGMITGCSGEPSSLSDKSSAASLTAKKINELRKEYPLSTGSPQNVDLRDLTFKEVLPYYVVDDDYVLSAFEGQTEEMKAFSRETNGYKLDHLIAEIKALKGK